jgi:hypothetical protein
MALQEHYPYPRDYLDYKIDIRSPGII